MVAMVTFATPNFSRSKSKGVMVKMGKNRESLWTLSSSPFFGKENTTKKKGIRTGCLQKPLLFKKKLATLGKNWEVPSEFDFQPQMFPPPQCFPCEKKILWLSPHSVEHQAVVDSFSARSPCVVAPSPGTKVPSFFGEVVKQKKKF